MASVYPRIDRHYRSTALNRLKSERFDLLVVGGGITGVGIALDAASRGFKVALVEKNDFASGTSSRSTKLIHGGLRYLKNYEFKLVREVGKEREVVFKNAPHLVKPMPILLPLTRHGQLGPKMTSLGLWIYDRLAGVKVSERRRMLSSQKVAEVEPLLNGAAVVGGGLYVEYRTDDARLTLEIAKKAINFGGVLVNHVEVSDFLYEDTSKRTGQVSGASCRDVLRGDQIEIKADMVVNACGPWVDMVRNLNEPIDGKRLVLTKGVHIVVPKDKLPVNQILYFDVADGRMIFAIPREGMTYIGTTDTHYESATQEPGVTWEDVDYLLNAANEMFPSIELKRQDVCSTWSGLRPLIFEPQKGPSELSRQDEIFVSKSGLISIAGGKLTGYRKMAERVMDVVYSKISNKQKRDCASQSVTSDIALGAQPFVNESEVIELIDRLGSEIQACGGPIEHADTLVRRYGREAIKIWESAREKMKVDFDEEKLFMEELSYCLNHEMVQTPADFLVRRTGMLYFHRNKITQERIDMVVEKMKKFLGEDYLDWQQEADEIRAVHAQNLPI